MQGTTWGPAKRRTCMRAGADSANDDPLSDANEIAFEALDAMRTVHAFSLQPRMAAAVSAALARPQAQLRHAALAAGLLCGASQFAACGLFSLAFWYGSMLVADGELTPRTLLIVLFAILLCSLAAVDAHFTFPDVATGATAVARVFRGASLPLNVSHTCQSPQARVLRSGHNACGTCTLASMLRWSFCAWLTQAGIR